MIRLISLHNDKFIQNVLLIQFIIKSNIKKKRFIQRLRQM